MLLPWSKKSVLSISPQGMALRTGNQLPQLLTDSSFVWEDANACRAALEQHAARLKQQAIEIVIANSLVRYSVLPWQAGVYRRQDWQAIAQHAFKKSFGADADSWAYAVCLNRYQSPVLAAAIDQTLMTQLQSLADSIGFELMAVTPLLAKLQAQRTSHPQAWLCVVEPQRIVLLQMNAEGHQQVLVDTPPAGAECLHAQQLVQRALLQSQQAAFASDKPVVYVSGALKSVWDEAVAGDLRLATPIQGGQSHAVWIAGV